MLILLLVRCNLIRDFELKLDFVIVVTYVKNYIMVLNISTEGKFNNIIYNHADDIFL